MKVLRLIPFLFLFFGSFPYQNFVYAENENPNKMIATIATICKKLNFIKNL